MKSACAQRPRAAAPTTSSGSRPSPCRPRANGLIRPAHATNTPMYMHMEDDMDVNCGTIFEGEETVQQCGERIFDLILKTASGQPTKSESFAFGGAEFAPG